MTPAHRIRILLIGLAVAVLLGLLFWPEEEEPRWPGVNWRTPPAEPTPKVAASDTTTESDYTPPPATYSDSEHTEHLQRYGVIAKYRERYADTRNDTASYYIVTSRDSTRDLSALGFIRGTALLDTSSRFTAVGDSGTVPMLRLTDHSALESRLRKREDGCSENIMTALRRTTSGDAPWLLAFNEGGASPVPPGLWQSAPASSLDSSWRADVMRLARELHLESHDTAGLASAIQAFAAAPMLIEHHFRFTADGAEIIIADVRRSGELRMSENGRTSAEQVDEQRVFIAERDAADPQSQFKVMWQHYGGGWVDDISTEVPILVLRLGKSRLLTVYTAGRYKDGMGGTFLSRTAKSRWEEVASWTAGC